MKKSKNPLSTLPAPEFIHAFNQGDMTIFSNLFNDLYPPLCYFASQLVKDKSCAEDLAKDTFIKLWAKRAEFPSFPQIKTFLYVTTRNAALNVLRHQQVKSRTQKELLYLGSHLHDQDMLGLLIKTELMAELIRAKRCLTPQQKRIVDLKYYEGLSNEKVALRLGVTVSTVKTQIGRAIAKLKSYFKNNKEAYVLFVALMSSDFDHHPIQNRAATKVSIAQPNSDSRTTETNLGLNGRKVDFRQPNIRSNVL